jgi:beta-glucosidase/6-phospho-beta-glucosidase/beta-galactosidase
MKHLKRFESLIVKVNNPEKVDKEELREFCEMYLSYLLDEGFEIYIVEHHFMCEINLHRSSYPEQWQYSGFKWEEIVDRFIPFLKVLYDKYVSFGNKCIKLETANGMTTNVYISDFLNNMEIDMNKIDRIPITYKRLFDNSPIYNIQMKIEKNK